MGLSGQDGLSQPVRYLTGVGPVRARELQKLGIDTVLDLIYHLPRRHEDRTRLRPISQLRHGEFETVKGIVAGTSEFKPRRDLTITKVAITDSTGTAYAVWYNQPYMKQRFKPGTPVIFSGRVERRFGQVQISNPEYEVIDGSDNLHAGRIVPVYPLAGQLSQRFVRAAVKNAVDRYASFIPEILPEDLRQRYAMVSAAEAWRNIHFPEDMSSLEHARTRLAFEELFVLQLGLAVLRKGFQVRRDGVVHSPDGPLMRRFYKRLPFTLTPAQQRVIREIARDMESPHPMNRLVQGDVGSGKTVVAAAALLKAVESGYQGTLMAPTEILAEQHYNVLSGLMQGLGVRIGLITGSLGRREKEAMLEAVRTGELDVVVGTHALIQDEVEFKRLSLAITDEQHRFGVRQRARLQEKGYAPDVLVMTATPIPRTLALTLYGDLDISVIDQMPPGRKPVETHWLPERKRKEAYQFIRRQIQEGRQAYVVCPLIEESDNLEEEAAMELAATLQQQVFPDLKIGLVHGRLKAQEKEQVMKAFRGGEIHILVATSVIEVGMDVPNASVILVEGADRFGLAQLHQLRGRVGRSQHQSYCLLLADPKTEEGRRRLQIMTRTSDGFAIAEEDLALRGPGEFFGTRQHGLPDLRVANPLRDLELLEKARKEAFSLVERDPELSRPEHRPLRHVLNQKFPDNLELIG